MEEEIWKVWLRGCYEASNLGRIRSMDRVVPFRGTPGLRKGIILKQTRNSKGYLTVVICFDSTRRTYNSHRIIAETFLDNPNDLPQVNHKDGDRLNNAVDNLEWISASDNQKHAYENNLKGRGEAHGCAKLKETDIPLIRSFIAAGDTDKNIAEAFGVTGGTIRGIRDNRSWRHIK